MDSEERHSDHEPSISLADPAHLEHWASKLGITSEHLRELIGRVGPRVRDLTAELARPSNVD